jgi:hypothetical protein
METESSHTEALRYQETLAFIRGLADTLSVLPVAEFLLPEPNSDTIDAEVEEFVENLDRAELYSVLENLPSFASFSVIKLEPELQLACQETQTSDMTYPHTLALTYQTLIINAFCACISLKLQALDKAPEDSTTSGATMMIQRQTGDAAFESIPEFEKVVEEEVLAEREGPTS